MIHKIIFPKLIVAMHTNNMNYNDLCKKADIGYESLRRKLRGESNFTLDECFRIKKALNAHMCLDILFECNQS